MTVYKIRHRGTGQFYSGRRPYKLNDQLVYGLTGKSWSLLGHAKNAIAHSAELAEHCEIVEFFISEVGRLLPLNEFDGATRKYQSLDKSAASV
jgi:hypothetical protein